MSARGKQATLAGRASSSKGLLVWRNETAATAAMTTEATTEIAIVESALSSGGRFSPSAVAAAISVAPNVTTRMAKYPPILATRETRDRSFRTVDLASAIAVIACLLLNSSGPTRLDQVRHPRHRRRACSHRVRECRRDSDSLPAKGRSHQPLPTMRRRTAYRLNVLPLSDLVAKEPHDEEESANRHVEQHDHSYDLPRTRAVPENGGREDAQPRGRWARSSARRFC